MYFGSTYVLVNNQELKLVNEDLNFMSNVCLKSQNARGKVIKILIGWEELTCYLTLKI